MTGLTTTSDRPTTFMSNNTRKILPPPKWDIIGYSS